MKYIVMLGDGMADEPIEALGGKDPSGVCGYAHPGRLRAPVGDRNGGHHPGGHVSGQRHGQSFGDRI